MTERTLEQVQAMPVVRAMRSQTPVQQAVLHVPVCLPRELYYKAMDWEHDDAVVASMHISKAILTLLRDMPPRTDAFHKTQITCREGLLTIDEWFAENGGDIQSEHVTVNVPIPSELVKASWGHWLSVEIGRYAGRVICASMRLVSEILEHPPDTLERGLISEWDAIVEGKPLINIFHPEFDAIWDEVNAASAD